MAIYDKLNDKQKEAVLHTEGPLLILAGAGSGKTRTIVHRIAHLIDDCGVAPYNILAITFTNKAAEEMRSRVYSLLYEGEDSGADRRDTGASDRANASAAGGASDGAHAYASGAGSNAYERAGDIPRAYTGSVWVSTFHSFCARILRRHGEMLGYTANYTIYDTDDSRALMRRLIQKQNLNPRDFKERGVLARISSMKNAMQSPDSFYKEAAGNWREMKVADLYSDYQEALAANDAMDFDDLLLNVIKLFKGFPDVLAGYQERFRYIMVDEYQDTNAAQFELVRLLASRYRNLCVVGDDDQSIYAFRGADIRNILDFEKEYRDALVVRLEQNYRSTKNILAVANAVISHNRGRKAKSLWTQLDEGQRVSFTEYQNADEEARGVAEQLKELQMRGVDLDEAAVLYRTNAQSRLLEEACIRQNVPYRLIGGVNFYQRAEIKDMLAYLRTVASGRDDVSVRRIINVPKRAIGKTTVDRVTAYADSQGIGFFEACRRADEIMDLGKASAKVLIFVDLIDELRPKSGEGIDALLRRILDRSGYMAELKADKTPEGEARIENIEELISKAADFEEQTGGEGTLADFLEEVSLIADIDSMEDDTHRAVLMTLHSSKGLEFDHVFMTGLEEGLFPSFRSISDIENQGVEEERRLCYVGITRARETLHISSARRRMVNGEYMSAVPSRFIEEIPEGLLDDDTPAEEEAAPFLQSAGKRWEYDGGRFGRGGRDAGGGSGYGGRRFGDGPSRRRRSPENGPSYDEGAIKLRGTVLSSGGSAKKALPEYTVGDCVRHKKFGEGKVLAVNEEKRDYEVTVDFDEFGIKKMLAGFAKLEKV